MAKPRKALVQNQNLKACEEAASQLRRWYESESNYELLPCADASCVYDRISLSLYIGICATRRYSNLFGATKAGARTDVKSQGGKLRNF